MDSGLYTAYSGLRATAEMLDVLSNNLANVNTTGFKSDEAFLGIYNHAISAEGASPLDGAINDSSAIRGTVSNFLPGLIKTTGRDLDVALEGKGFLVLQGSSGLMYTRNGNLHVNAQGALVNSEGVPVLGENGPIQLPPGHVTISAAGEIDVDGSAVDRLKVVDFQLKSGLEKVGNSSFRSPGTEGTPLEPGEINIRQGGLEQSNVNPVKEMMLMITVMRQFESLQKTIYTMMNTVNDRSINQVGRVNG